MYAFLYVIVMKIINATYARNHWFSILKSLSKDQEEPTIIHHKDGDCVLISMEEWESIQETLFLFANPKTRKDIQDSLNTPHSEYVRVDLE